MEQLHGRTAVVTGAGSGIGEGIVAACADAGMRVVVSDIELEQAERVASAVRERGGEAIAVRTDVTDRVALDELADRAYEAFGAVHLLCNNAGVISVGPIAGTTPEDWQWVFSVNVFGIVHGIQAFVPRMRAQDPATVPEHPDSHRAHIVNTGSMSSITTTRAIPVGVYTASKHAVAGLSEMLRHELADDGIGVSILCPGGVQTRLFEAQRNLPERLHGRVTPAAEARDIGRMDPREVGERVLEAVRANRYYIISHPEQRPRVERRCTELLSAFDEAAATSSPA